MRDVEEVVYLIVGRAGKKGLEVQVDKSSAPDGMIPQFADPPGCCRLA